MKDLYKALNISETATEQEIKKAYRKLAKEYHPDKCKTAECEEKFKEINAANEVLSNKEKRAQYDMVGDEAFGQGGFQQYSQQHQGVDLNDILNQMFGGGTQNNNPFSGGSNPFGGFSRQEPDLDITVRVKVPLENAITGGKVNIKGNNVTIPKKVGQGTKLRVKGGGDTYNGKTGDLYIQLVIISDDIFELNENEINTDIILNLKEAIFGCSKTINLYGEEIKFKIPKDVKYGQNLRLKGKGLKKDNLIIHVKYELPKSTDIKESDLDFLE